MAFCRFGKNSDVYMLNHSNGNIQCCACHLTTVNKTGHKSVNLKTTAGAFRHLVRHMKAGHKVSKTAVLNLYKERR